MKPHPPTLILLAIALLALIAITTTVAAPLGTAFTYQGRLASGDSAANGSYDLKFSLYDAASCGPRSGSQRSQNERSNHEHT